MTFFSALYSANLGCYITLLIKISVLCGPVPGRWRSAPVTRRSWPSGSGEDLGHPEGRKGRHRTIGTWWGAGSEPS